MGGMMDEHEQSLRRQLSAMFSEELADRVEELRRVATELETTPASPESRAALHRVLHVIKGASRSVGEQSIEAACHRLETQLAELAADQPPPIALIYELADALDEARGALRHSTPLAAARFDRIAASGPVAEQPDVAAHVIVTPADDGGETFRVAASALDALVSQSAAAMQARQSLGPVLRAFEQLRDEAAGQAWLRGLERCQRALVASVDRVARSSEILDDQIRRLRLRPFEEVVAGCARIAREAAAGVGKQIELVIEARGVQLDRVQVEALRDVMVQLVRNAVAHGIETPEARAAAGKSPRGQILVEATPHGDAFTLQVRDDGAGLDVAWLKRLAAERGRTTTDPRELARLVFEPGVSSAPVLTELAGRGVGLDVVRQRVERLHGSVRVEWVAGEGTTFTIELPITVATLRSLIVESGGVTYAVPISAVERLVWITPAAIQRGETRELIRVGDDWLVAVSLEAVLGKVPATSERRVPGIVLSHAGRRVVVAADHIVDAIEVAFESLDPRLGRIRAVAGVTTLPDGALALILQASDLVDAALASVTPAAFARATPTRAPRTVLLVDDSATTRALESNILRAAGYVVRTAVDGEDAWRQLSEARCDILVSDVDMPNLNGIELTRRVRGSPELASVPVILVSARSTDEDRARGMHAGANAYIVKGSFDQKVLLETLARLS